jgi:hypothetical protein
MTASPRLLRVAHAVETYLPTTQNWLFRLLEGLPSVRSTILSKEFLHCNFYSQKFSYVEFPLRPVVLLHLRGVARFWPSETCRPPHRVRVFELNTLARRLSKRLDSSASSTHPTPMQENLDGCGRIVDACDSPNAGHSCRAQLLRGGHRRQQHQTASG